MAEATDPGGPLWWLKTLDAQLRKRERTTIKRWDAYYRGEHPLLFVGEKFRDAFGPMFRPFADNWMPLVVDSVEERLHVEGFRFGQEADVPRRPRLITDTSGGDADAWYAWQANNLDFESTLAHREALICGIVYGLVDPTVELGAKKVAQITIEHPTQMILATDPANRRRRLAALKRWREDDGTDMATVYFDEDVWRYKRDRRNRHGWVPRDRDDGRIDNPMGEVPVVAIANQDRLLRTQGVAEHDQVIPVQDAINKLFCDLLIASEFAAFRQRWATGMDIPKDKDGNPYEPFNAAVNRMFINENPEGRFGSFDATDLTNYVKAIELGTRHLGARSRTPAHYMLGEIENVSGDTLKAAETGLTSKVYERQRAFGDPWEDLQRLQFKARNDPRADDVTAETIWGNPESRSESEHVDATIKKLSAGVPLAQIWEDLGYTPQQRARFKDMLRQQALEQASLGLDVKNLFGADVIDDGGEEDEGAAA